jgi:hypothetical protein
MVLKDFNGTAERGVVRICADPITLKETRQLSKVSLNYPEGGVAKKATVLQAIVELTGPGTQVEALLKRIDLGKILAQIDR